MMIVVVDDLVVIMVVVISELENVEEINTVEMFFYGSRSGWVSGCLVIIVGEVAVVNYVAGVT